MTGISLNRVSKVYPNGVRAVDELSLEIAEGEFCVLVGPSGCGKSTLLRMIAGLEEVTEGDVLIGGVDVTDEPPQQRDIAMVFQNYALYPHMTVKENLAFGLKLRKLPKAEWQSTGRRSRKDARARRAARPQAVGTLGWTAAARRDGSRDRSRAEGLPDGRAALEPRCQASRLDAGRARPAARAARRDDGLRDA